MKIELICDKFENFIPKENINLTFLDPPDNENRRYTGYCDKLDTMTYIDLLEKWIYKACKITNGPVFVSFAEKYIPIIEKIIIDNKIQLTQRIWWYYTFGQANTKRYSPCCRPIYWLNSPIIYPEAIKIPSARQKVYGDRRAAKNGKMPSNVWEFSRICGTFKERRAWHLCQFPEKLIERIVLGHSKDGDTVLDGFLGSGTSAIVCKRLNRNLIGIDCSQFYINKIKEIL